MSLSDGTITSPAAGFAPILTTVSSSRPYPETEAITAIADGNATHAGTTRLTVASITNFEVADCITISGATGTAAWLNGRHDIHYIDDGGTKYIYIETAYLTTTTGDKGTITRSNGSVKIKTEITIGSIVVASFYSYPVWDDDGYYSVINLAPFIQPHFSSDFTLTPGITSASGVGALVTYSVTFTEYHQRADYSYFADTNGAQSQTGLEAHRSVKISDRIVNDVTPGENQFLTDKKTVIYPDNCKVILHAICTAADCYVVLTKQNSIPPNVDTKIDEVKDDHILIVIDPSTFNNSDFTVKIQNHATGGDPVDWVSETISFVNESRCYPYNKVLYFLNRYGGWDMYNFRDISKEVFKAEKVSVGTFTSTQSTSKLTTLQGRPETRTSIQWLRDIISSPEVYDNTGARVYIKNSELITKDGDEILIPEITIEEFEDEFIN